MSGKCKKRRSSPHFLLRHGMEGLNAPIQLIITPDTSANHARWSFGEAQSEVCPDQ